MAESQYIADSAHDPYPLLNDVRLVPPSGVPPMSLNPVSMALDAGIASLPRASYLVNHNSFRS